MGKYDRIRGESREEYVRRIAEISRSSVPPASEHHSGSGRGSKPPLGQAREERNIHPSYVRQVGTSYAASIFRPPSNPPADVTRSCGSLEEITEKSLSAAIEGQSHSSGLGDSDPDDTLEYGIPRSKPPAVPVVVEEVRHPRDCEPVAITRGAKVADYAPRRDPTMRGIQASVARSACSSHPASGDDTDAFLDDLTGPLAALYKASKGNKSE